MTFEYDDGVDAVGRFGGISKVIADWTSDSATGAVAGTTRKIVGELIKVVTDPGATAPSDNWDVVVTDEEGTDVMAKCQNAALLIARDTANSEETYLYILNADATAIGVAAFPVVCDKLTISIANAGNSKAGQVILYVRQP